MHSALNLRKIIKEHMKTNPWQFTGSYSLEKRLKSVQNLLNIFMRWVLGGLFKWARDIHDKVQKYALSI